MRRCVVLALLAVFAAGSVTAQQPASPDPFHVALRLAGDRVSFKIGEPIRLELVVSADRPGYFVDSAGADDGVEPLSIVPEQGVHRLRANQGRDYRTVSNLSSTPTVIPLAVNYWARFDRVGTYTVSLQTERVIPVKEDGHSLGKALVIKTNPVTFQIEATSPEDERQLTAAATRHLETVLAMAPGDLTDREEIRAGEELAFLPGDEAALEKYRWYRRLGSPNRLRGFAFHLVRRGFAVTRNPQVILDQIEQQLTDLSVRVTATDVGDATALAVAVKYPDYVEKASSWTSDVEEPTPYLIERAKYLEILHDSLAFREGASKLQAANAIIDLLDRKTPTDVVRLIVDQFEQFSLGARIWFASGRWDTIRDARLGPALRRTLDEAGARDRSQVYPALIDVAPDLALDPLSRDILDPTLTTSDDIVRKMPRSSLSPIAPELLASVQKMIAALDRNNLRDFRTGVKIKTLAAIADGTLRRQIRELYDGYSKALDSGVRASLLSYLLAWDPEEGTRRTLEVVQAAPDNYPLYELTENGTSPALNMILRDRLFASDLSTVSSAATLLARHAGSAELNAIELRLFQWRMDRQRRLTNGEALTNTDIEFEKEMAWAILLTHRSELASAVKDKLIAACLTEGCRDFLRKR